MGENKLDAQIKQKKLKELDHIQADSYEDIQDCLSCRFPKCINCKDKTMSGFKQEKRAYWSKLFAAYIENDSILAICWELLEYRSRVKHTMRMFSLPDPETIPRSEREKIVKERKKQHGII